MISIKCPNCGSENTIYNGLSSYDHESKTLIETHTCNNCHMWFHVEYNLTYCKPEVYYWD
jgi:formate dehydrogenase maturation protein FdhE